MKLTNLAFPIAAALAIALAGCSPQDATDKPTAAKPAQPYEAGQSGSDSN